jgi:hypothetical protein
MPPNLESSQSLQDYLLRSGRTITSSPGSQWRATRRAPVRRSFAGRRRARVR